MYSYIHTHSHTYIHACLPQCLPTCQPRVLSLVCVSKLPAYHLIDVRALDAPSKVVANTWAHSTAAKGGTREPRSSVTLKSARCLASHSLHRPLDNKPPNAIASSPSSGGKPSSKNHRQKNRKRGQEREEKDHLEPTSSPFNTSQRELSDGCGRRVCPPSLQPHARLDGIPDLLNHLLVAEAGRIGSIDLVLVAVAVQTG